MQPLRIAPPLHHATGELINDDHLVVAHDVVGVALEDLVRPHGLVDVVDDGDVLHVVEAWGVQHLQFRQPRLHMLLAFFGQGCAAGLLVNLDMLFGQFGNQRVDGEVQVG